MSDYRGALLAMKREARSSKDPIFKNINGWRFSLSCNPVNVSQEIYDKYKDTVAKRMNLPPFPTFEAYKETTKHKKNAQHGWIFGASLSPRGRSSTEKDWTFLGTVVAILGAPEYSLRTPIETTDPSEVHYWMWDEVLS